MIEAVDCVEPLVTFVLSDLPPLQFALDSSLYAGHGVSLQLAKSMLFQSDERKLHQSLSSTPLTVILSDLRYQKQLGFCSIGMSHFVNELAHVASPSFASDNENRSPLSHGAATSYHQGVFVFYDQAGAAVASASLYLRMLCVGRSAAASSPQLLYALSSKRCIVLPGTRALPCLSVCLLACLCVCERGSVLWLMS